MSASTEYLTDAPRVPIKKPNASNYYLWSNKMVVILQERGHWRFVSNGRAADGNRDAEEEDQEELKKDMEMPILLVSIVDECIAPVICLSDPK